MNETVQDATKKQNERLIKLDESDMVGVDFRHLDQLIGSLCHVMDLNSDKEYREHVKSEIKMRCREWLQQQYDNAGYYRTTTSIAGTYSVSARDSQNN